jgi:hypothetical protein
MKRAIHIYNLLNILSVDIAAGAVVCTAFFAKIFDVYIKPFGYISLGLTVWIIYTVDHLLDARNTQHTAATLRHRFHQWHFKTLFSIVVIAALIDVVQLFFIRRQLIISGLILASLIVIYLLIQRYLRFVKELFGALLYSGGVLLAPLSLMITPLSLMQALLISQFFITAFINLLLFSWFDKVNDTLDKHQSFTTFFGESATLAVLLILFSINGILAIIQIKTCMYSIPSSIIFSMNMILFMIMILRKHFAVNERYRLLGDAIFILPILYVM